MAYGTSSLSTPPCCYSYVRTHETEKSTCVVIAMINLLTLAICVPSVSAKTKPCHIDTGIAYGARFSYNANTDMPLVITEMLIKYLFR